MATDIDREYDLIERNRFNCPRTVGIAEVLFDLAHEHHSSILEDLAIQVDGAAQVGHELTAADYNDVLTAAAKALGGKL